LTTGVRLGTVVAELAELAEVAELAELRELRFGVV